MMANITNLDEEVKCAIYFRDHNNMAIQVQLAPINRVGLNTIGKIYPVLAIEAVHMEERQRVY